MLKRVVMTYLRIEMLLVSLCANRCIEVIIPHYTLVEAHFCDPAVSPNVHDSAASTSRDLVLGSVEF